MVSGCSQPKTEPKYALSEAQKKFEEKCLKDFNLHLRTRQVGQTFWIYLPTKDPIFDYEVQKNAPGGDKPKDTPRYAVNFADGKYNQSIFSFEYDIVDKKKTKDEDYGFGSSYTDSYIKNQNNIFTAISEIFFNIKPETGLSPTFFVVVITDIKKGIETRSTFYLKDFMRAMTGDLPQDEYMKRFISDRKGSQEMVGDETGSHIVYSDMTMEEFLTKQVVTRINFKFQYSDFAPKDPNFDDTIISIVADTLRYYDYKDYTNVRLINLRSKQNYLFDKDQLVNFGDDKPKENKGKLVHIRFKDGKPEFMDEETSENAQ